jgi:anti-anti-sigma factor
MLDINYNQSERIITLTFNGRMDTMAVMKMNDLIGGNPIMINRKTDDHVVFDVGGVDYIASSFIRICVNHAKLAGPGNFSMVNCQPFVKKTFKISGLDDVLNIR